MDNNNQQQDQNLQQPNPVSEPAVQPIQPVDPLKTMSADISSMQNVSSPTVQPEVSQNTSSEDKVMQALTRIEEKLTAISAKIGA